MGVRSCTACGAPFERACPACGAGAPESARFCMACGGWLDADLGSPVAVGGQERRTVTVMFADLSGFTAISEQLDPELLGSVVGGAMRRLAAEVRRFGGRVDKFIGDSVMALFGAPVAHEDDARRAVLAALGMQAAMREINDEFGARHGASFELRVGINTGEVLAGTVGEAYTVIGDAANTAQRLQAAARPGTITVGRATVAATRESVGYRELAPLVLKGKSEPVPAWEAVGLIGEAVGDGVEAGRAGGRDGSGADGRTGTPFVGRRGELAALVSLAVGLGAGRAPHLATVVGQAGVGKSRLLWELELVLAASADGPRLRRGRSLPYGNNVVFWPLGEVLRAECGIVDGDASGVAWTKLSRRLAELLGGERGEPSVESAQIALIGRLLGVEAPAGVESPSGAEAQRMRETFFATVRAIVDGMARERPLVLAWEDIHWADEGMLDLIEYLAKSLREPVLLICLAREDLLERRPSWGLARRNATTVFVDPLGEDQTVELVSGLVGSERHSPELIATVAERAGGNPLFAEELVRRLAEEGPDAAVELPHTVQALLAARLDSLGGLERRVLAHAAVVGRTFWAGALADVTREDGGDLDAALGVLRDKDLIVSGEGGVLAGEPELAFRHVLIRDVAYRMLPKSVRARKHFEVGRFIEDRAGDRTDEVVALVAEHFDRAAQLGGEVKLAAGVVGPYRERALVHLEAAGDAARAFYSNEEALTRYESARGYASSDAVATRIDEKRGDVLLSLGRVDAAIGLWEAALAYQSDRGDQELVAGLHRKLGAALAHKGERREAIAHHQQGISLIADGAPSTVLVGLYEEAAWLYMETGDNMLAIYSAEKALQLAEQTGEPGAASRARGIFGRIFGRIGDTVKARENLELAVELGRAAERQETVLALLALGHHLESAEAAYAEARSIYEEGLELARQIGEVPAQIELLAGLTQLGLYACDWTSARATCEAAVGLGERDGLIGKLCLPYAQLGMLRWREGDWESAESGLRRAHRLAVQAGASEAAFMALHGLALTLYDRGEFGQADAAILESLDVCEHAGLVGQSIEATATRALVLRGSGRDDEAWAVAREAQERAGQMGYPVGRAAALEAVGVAGELPEAVDRLRAASEAWAVVGRPLEQARCQLELGIRIGQSDVGRGTAVVIGAADAFERLGVVHVAARTRRFARGVVA